MHRSCISSKVWPRTSVWPSACTRHCSPCGDPLGRLQKSVGRGRIFLAPTFALDELTVARSSSEDDLAIICSEDHFAYCLEVNVKSRATNKSTSSFARSIARTGIVSVSCSQWLFSALFWGLHARHHCKEVVYQIPNDAGMLIVCHCIESALKVLCFGLELLDTAGNQRLREEPPS